jgi:carbon starvation protein CstA
MGYGTYHWISRAPLKILPIWNLLGIFDYLSWMLLIFTMFVVYGFLWVTAKVGACYGLAFHYEEIPLFPVR